ncbi:MAG: DUF169 domain-containing protein [Archaeoglobaceae archaeon]
MRKYFKESKQNLSARYNGRTVLLTVEDFACPPSMLIYGIATGKDPKEILVGANWLKDLNCDFDVKCLPEGKYKSFAFGDMTKMKEKPDVILIFGKPEQIGRLIQAKTFFGGKVTAELTAKMTSCAEALIPAINGEVAIAVPGAGDRVFSGLDESEMIFAMPYSWIDRILEGLEKAGKGANVGYPPSPFLFFTPRFPKSYREIEAQFKLLE